jgi:hypothetical protein
LITEYLDGDGAVMFRHACAMGLEGHRLEEAEFAVSVRPVAALG